MFCTYCGIEIPNDSKYCGGCGRKVDVEIVTRMPDHQSVTVVQPQQNIEYQQQLYMQAQLTMQQEALRIQQQQLYEQQAANASMARCPRCGSTTLSGNKKGFGIGKAVIGASLIGPFGLVAGNLGAKKVVVTCLKCGKKFKI